jgi:hypothetical protein
MRFFSVLGWEGWQLPNVTGLLERAVTVTVIVTMCSIRSNCWWRKSRKSFILSFYFFFFSATAQVAPVRLVVKVSRSRTIRRSHTPGRTPLNQWSVCRRGRLLHNTQQTHQTSLHALSNSSIQAASDLRLRSHGCRLRPILLILVD